MRILYLNKHFPGPFYAVASYFAKQKNVTSIFISEKNANPVSIPNIRRIYSPTVSSKDFGNSLPTERFMLEALRRGSSIANILLRLSTDGFYPDIIYVTQEDGYALYVHDIFPKARIILRATWFNQKGDYYTFFNQGVARPPTEFAIGRLSNLLQFNTFSDATLAITSSEWQKKQFPPELAEKITIVHDGIRTQSFKPSHTQHQIETVVFSCQDVHPNRGIETLCAALPLLLRQKPQCEVCLLSFTPPTTSKKQGIEAFFPKLSPEELARVHIIHSPKPQDYVRILQQCRAYVYLTAPSTLSAGLYEAMSCGACVIASDTEPVLDIISHAENGFLCDFWDAEALVDIICTVLDRYPKLKYISNNAREYILEHHDFSKQLTKHIDLILQK